MCGVTKGVDEKIDEVFVVGSAMWREWRVTGLLRGSIRGVYW